MKRSPSDSYSGNYINSISKSRQKKQQEAEYAAEVKRNQVRTIVLVIFTMLVFLADFILVGELYIFKNSTAEEYVIRRDKKAPIVEVRDITVINDEIAVPEDFVVGDVIDDTKVTCDYETVPDFSKAGTFDVKLTFTDQAGNTTKKTAKLTIIKDREAPVIKLSQNEIDVELNEKISYKKLIASVTDDQDQDPTINIDNSSVDLTSAGDYVVIYEASDSIGNTSTAELTVHVREDSDPVIIKRKCLELAEKTLAKIITDDMDDLHKVWAVYKYVQDMRYSAPTVGDGHYPEGFKGDVYEYCYNMLSELHGDCYGSYATVYVLLTQLGIECKPIETDRTYTGAHYWNLVTIDGGKTWYHVDATHWHEWDYVPVMCMISDARLEEISEFHRGTHIFDHSLYPATPEESLAVPADIVEKYEIVDRIE